MSKYEINNEKQLDAYIKIRNDIDSAINLYKNSVDSAEKPLYNSKEIYVVEHYVKGSNAPRGELFINWPFYF